MFDWRWWWTIFWDWSSVWGRRHRRRVGSRAADRKRPRYHKGKHALARDKFGTANDRPGFCGRKRGFSFKTAYLLRKWHLSRNTQVEATNRVTNNFLITSVNMPTENNLTIYMYMPDEFSHNETYLRWLAKSCCALALFSSEVVTISKTWKTQTLSGGTIWLLEYWTHWSFCDLRLLSKE